MGFFRNLWDEALAGPAPDSGVGKFRRYNSLFSRQNNPPTAGDNTPVSHSITILRTDSLSSSDSTPSSPAGSSAAGSPFSAASPGGDFNTAEAHRREPKSPTGYDWIVLTSLDR
ncbi:dormancy-associated protein homolog 4-like [Bidens hawaiensis]|uniref:dormancy-associated protein homolog 4-like n=1 Tax=Bidens hawaiensis TaxID=980011 RepID=UPI00404B6A53